MNKLRGLSSFGELLLESGAASDYIRVMETLKQMGPSAIDLELRSLDMPILLEEDEAGTGDEVIPHEKPVLLLHFMRAIQQKLESRKDFELTQSYLGLFLKIHSETIMRNHELRNECRVVSECLSGVWADVDMKFNKSLCIINFLRSSLF